MGHVNTFFAGGGVLRDSKGFCPNPISIAHGCCSKQLAVMLQDSILQSKEQVCFFYNYPSRNQSSSISFSFSLSLLTSPTPILRVPSSIPRVLTLEWKPYQVLQILLEVRSSWAANPFAHFSLATANIGIFPGTIIKRPKQLTDPMHPAASSFFSSRTSSLEDWSLLCRDSRST